MAKKRWYKPFLEAFRRFPVVLPACRHAGIGRTAVYRAIKEDKWFRDEVENARQEALEYLEAQAWSRATAKKEPSDRLLIFLLQNNVQRYAKKQQVTVQGDLSVEHQHRLELLSRDEQACRLLTELSVRAATLGLTDEGCAELTDADDDDDEAAE